MSRRALACSILFIGASAAGCGSSGRAAGAGGAGGNDPPGTGGGSVTGGTAGTDGTGSTSGGGEGGNDDAGSDSMDAQGSTEAGSAAGLWVMGYYSSWNASSYPIDQIDWNALTHIATAFNVPDGNGGVNGLESIDSALARSVVAAAHAAGKKAIASIGGAGSSPVFQGSTSPANLSTFVNNLQSLVTNLGYDGLDLDWEGGPPSDQALLMSLVQAVRGAMPAILITMPVMIQNNNLKANLSFYGNVAPLVDQINIMSYNVSGAYPGWKSWHSSPLHWNRDSATPVGIDITVADYLRANVPASKLGIGTGFFGECYSSPVTAPAQALAGSTVLANDGIMTYAHVMNAYYSSTARQWDATAMVPYLSFAAAHGPEMCTYVTYEDAESIAAKAAWVKSNGLGGTIVWTINEGYLASAPAGQKSPLLDAVKSGFMQ